MIELTILMPAYNEETSIKKTILECIRLTPDSKILVIDDCSKDNTNKIIKELQREYKQIELIRNDVNKNYGGALKVGYKHFKTKYVVFLDADDTYSPEYIPVLLNEIKLNNADCVITNRFGTQRNSMPFYRKVGNKTLSLLFFLFTGKYMADVCSGMRIFSREGMEKLDYETLPNGLDMITAMTKRIVSRKVKYEIIPIKYYRREGYSKLRIFTDFLRMARNIIVEK